MAKLGRFRGESRFTTWAYKFAVLEVSAKLGRRFWQRPAVTLEAGQWDELPDRLGLRPMSSPSTLTCSRRCAGPSLRISPTVSGTCSLPSWSTACRWMR